MPESSKELANRQVKVASKPRAGGGGRGLGAGIRTGAAIAGKTYDEQARSLSPRGKTGGKPVKTVATTAPAGKETSSMANQAVTAITDRIRSFALKTLMAKDRLTVSEIAIARTLIEQEPAETQGDLWEALQSKTEYQNQRDAASSAEEKTGGLCNLTSLAMCLEYLGIANPYPDMQYEDALEKIRKDNKYGARTTKAGWSAVAKKMGATPVDVAGAGKHDRAFWKDTVRDKYLRTGHSVMMSITGHIVRLQSVTDAGLVVDDPYGVTKVKAGTKYSVGTFNTSKFKNDYKSIKKDAGEDNVWAWDDVEVHSFLWIEAFKK